MPEQIEVVIIGAGQAGLAAGYYLTQQNRPFVILEQAAQVGQSWRDRWDSLKLITPTPYNNLPGLPFPATPNCFPTKAETIAYLEQYVQKFQLPIHYHQPVKRLQPTSQGYCVETPTTTWIAQQVIVATGPYQAPAIPAFAAKLPDRVYQLHSSQYRNPQQIPPGKVLVVGSGNSGAQIAKELSLSHSVYLSVGRNPRLPRQFLGHDIFWWLHALRLTRVSRQSRLGRTLSQRPDALIGIPLNTLATQYGVKLVSRVERVSGEQMILSNGESIACDSVIWATGFRPHYDWIEAPVLDAQGRPLHQQGITAAPGLYFLGLRWQSRLTSSLIGGIGEDAAWIATQVAAYAAQPKPIIELMPSSYPSAEGALS